MKKMNIVGAKLYKKLLSAYLQRITAVSQEKREEALVAMDEAIMAVTKAKEECDREGYGEYSPDEKKYLKLYLDGVCINGDGWRNLDPVAEELDSTIEGCGRILSQKNSDIRTLFNPDLPFANLNLTSVEDADDLIKKIDAKVEEGEEVIKESEHILKILKEDEEKRDEVAKPVVKKMSKLKIGGLVLGGLALAAGLALGVKHYLDDGVEIIDL